MRCYPIGRMIAGSFSRKPRASVSIVTVAGRPSGASRKRPSTWPVSMIWSPKCRPRSDRSHGNAAGPNATVSSQRRRFAVEVTLAAREMEAAQVETAGLDRGTDDLRQRVPQSEAAAGAAEQQRDAAHRDRAAAEAMRTELARLVAAQHQQASALQGEIAVAEERQRNAQSRRQRAEDERRAGEAVGTRVFAERDAAAIERREAEAIVTAASATLTGRVDDEDAARQSVTSDPSGSR